MNKFWVILSHTYMTRFKSKAFLIMTGIVVLFMIGFANIDKVIEKFAGDDSATEIAVIDNTDMYMDLLAEAINVSDEQIDLIAYEDTLEAGKIAIEDYEYDALLVLEATDENYPKATYYQNDALESWTEMFIEQQLQQIKTNIATQNAGVDETTLQEIYEAITFEKIALDETSKSEEELSEARGIVYVMLFVLYMTVIIYGQMISMDVATEKSSRVMEILISSAPPVTHMFAKIFGIALLGLTQLAIFFIVGFNLFKMKQDEMVGEFFEAFGFSNSSSISIYIYAVVFFVLGYLLYAMINAMLGSLVSRVEDVQQLIFPVVIMIMIAFFIAMFGLGAPEAKFITITSFIPFFSPMIMFLRVGMLDVPLWEIALSIGLLIATIILFAIIGARIYRGGVLMYGPSRSLKDFKKAFTLSKKEK